MKIFCNLWLVLKFEQVHLTFIQSIITICQKSRHLVAQLNARRTGDQGVRPLLGQQHSFMSLQLFQEGQLWVSGKRMCIILGNCFED